MFWLILRSYFKLKVREWLIIDQIQRLKKGFYVSAPIDIILDKWFQFLCMYYVYWKKVWIFIASDKIKCPCSEIACVLYKET